MHQLIAMFIRDLLRELKVNGERAGLAVVAPFKLKVRTKKYRQPDVLFMKRENANRIVNELWDYADFVVEVVSEGGEERDYQDKIVAYAEAGVPEYWIVDPQARRVTQNVLVAGRYETVGEFAGNEVVAAKTVPGFRVVVRDLFESAERELKMQ
jgi:Uma2 family endonuclease